MLRIRIAFSLAFTVIRKLDRITFRGANRIAEFFSRSWISIEFLFTHTEFSALFFTFHTCETAYTIATDREIAANVSWLVQRASCFNLLHFPVTQSLPTHNAITHKRNFDLSSPTVFCRDDGVLLIALLRAYTSFAADSNVKGSAIVRVVTVSEQRLCGHVR